MTEHVKPGTWRPVLKRDDNDPGWSGRLDDGRQRCDRCGKWQYPVIHSCPGVWNGER